MSRQSDVAAEPGACYCKAFMVLFIAANAFLKGTQQKLRVKQSKQRQKEKEAQRV